MPSIVKKTEKKERNVLVKMTERDYEEVKNQANKYTGGNVSTWIRYATKLEPRSEDIQEVEHEG